MWLDKGKTLAEGEPKRVVAAYLIDVEKAEEQQLAKDEAATVADVTSSSSSDAHAVSPRTSSILRPTCSRRPKGDGARARSRSRTSHSWARTATPGHVFQSGEPLEVRLKTRAHQPTNDFVFGVGLFNAEGICCYGTNTNIEELEPAAIEGNGEITFRIASLELVEGTYKIDVAVHKLDGYPYDYHRLLYTFRVKSRTKDVGIYRPRASLGVHAQHPVQVTVQ